MTAGFAPLFTLAYSYRFCDRSMIISSSLSDHEYDHVIVKTRQQNFSLFVLLICKFYSLQMKFDRSSPLAVLHSGRTTLVLWLVITTVVASAKGQLDGRLLDENEENESSFEAKAGLKMREVPLRNLIPMDGLKRLKCHACEPPNCEESVTGRHTCQQAVQCWKSRVREGE